LRSRVVDPSYIPVSHGQEKIPQIVGPEVAFRP
jgi:hypothetical protein